MSANHIFEVIDVEVEVCESTTKYVKYANKGKHWLLSNNSIDLRLGRFIMTSYRKKYNGKLGDSLSAQSL